MAEVSGAVPYQGELERWQTAGLIDAEQAARIADFERQRRKEDALRRPARAIALLGALTLVSGLGSIVAYNWDTLPPALKLTGMGVILLAAAIFAARAHARGGALFEAAAIVLSGASLASLALVSQVYHQDGELWLLLAAWCALSAPTLWLTKSRFSSLYLFCAVFVTLLTAADSLDDLLNATALRKESELGATFLVYGASALVAALLLRSRAPGRCAVGAGLVVLHLLALGIVGTLAPLSDGHPEPLLFLTALPLVLLVPALRGPHVGELGLGPWPVAAGLFLLGAVMAVTPLALFRAEDGVLAFVLFVLFFGAYFWAAHRAESENGVRVAVAALGIRIVIASFELFENLLVTGLVLAGVGALALYFTRKGLGGEEA